MKKLLLIFLLLFVVCGCTGKKEETPSEKVIDTDSLTIVTPTGAPVLAFYDQIANENYNRVAAESISALWTGDASPDILVVDLTSGVKAIANGADYKLGAILTFGNFYLASTSNDEDETMDTDDRIVLFGNENMLPSRIWHYLFNDEYDDSLVYEGNAQIAAAALASGKASDGSDVDYVFLAQPALFASMKKNEKAKISMDIQAEYKNRSGLDMIQAALFINNRVDQETADEFLKKLEASIAARIDNTELANEGLSVYKDEEALTQYGFNPAVVVNVMKQTNALGNNAMGLGFKRAIDIKDDIDAFLNVFGMDKTSEEIYFR